MTKKHRSREEPKFRIDDLEEENQNRPTKKWPIDEQPDKVEAELADDEEHDDIAGILEHPSYKELENKLTETEEKLHQCLMRSQAEMENLRRRCERDVSNAYKYSIEKLILDLFPVVDSLEKALESKVDNNEYAKKIHEGIELTMSLFLKVFDKFGIKQIDPVGETFNPELHQAISTHADPNAAENTVISVLQKGFTLNDRLLRPALVVVAKSS